EQAARAEHLQALGQITSGVAHDINNALTAVVGLSELLLQRLALPADDAATLRAIRTAGADAAETVRRMRHLARPEEVPGGRTRVRLDDLAADAVALTRPRWADPARPPAAAVRLATDFARPPAVEANPVELREVLVNLIFNAVDALPRGGT